MAVRPQPLSMVRTGLLLLLLVAAVAGGTANHSEEEVLDAMVSTEVLDGMGRSGAGLDAALQLWEPRALAAAWPHMAPLLHPACHRHLAQWLHDLARAGAPSAGDEQPNFWATRALDASGRYSRRLHSGNDFWLGSRDLCRQLDVAATGGDSDLSSHDTPPFRFDFHVAKITIQHDLLPQTRLVQLGLCVPATCDIQDTRTALTALADVGGGSALERNVTVDAVRVIGGANSYSFWADPRFSAMLGASIIIVILVIVATIYDFWILRKPILLQNGIKILENNNNSNYNHEGSVQYNYDKQISPNAGSASVNLNLTTFSNGTLCNGNKQKDVKHIPAGDCSFEKKSEEWKWREDVEDNVATQLLLSFSLRTNLQKLCSLNGGDDTLTPIHGLRVFTLMWIVLVHSCLITFQNADNKKFRMKAEQDFLYQTLSSGTYSVDTFFVISGMLVSFLYFRTVSKMSVKELTFAEGYKAGILQFIGMTIYRFIRLTPTYLYVLGIVSLSTKYFHDQSVMELPTRDHITCDKYWWRNILYINTFSKEDERCMSWSWYLANDTQFYTFGSILLIIAVSYFQVAVALAGIVLLSTWTTTAVITINTQHRPSIEDPFANYTDLYDKPWTRIGPYLIGMCAGWLLCRMNCQLKVHKGWIVFGWVTALSTMCSVVYGLYLIEFGPVLSAVYVALGHSAWALSIAWVVIACSTKNGGIINKILSWPYLYPISRLSYCTYLIHPQIIRIILLNYDTSFHLTIGIMGVVFGGFLLTSYFAALLITLTFEAPVVSLLRIAHPMRRKKSS